MMGHDIFAAWLFVWSLGTAMVLGIGPTVLRYRALSLTPVGVSRRARPDGGSSPGQAALTTVLGVIE
jgi:hypothetical protein